MGTELFERRVVISGVGQSAIGRQVDRSGFQLTLDAIGAAVAGAGLTLDDIDGLAMFPGGGAAAFGHTAEAVRQLRGEAGDRQVTGAQVAAVTNTGGIEAGAALLTRW